MKLHGRGSNHTSGLPVAIELPLRVRFYPLDHTVDLLTGCMLKTNIFLDLNKLLRTIDFTNL